jgi:hypothetical protein
MISAHYIASETWRLNLQMDFIRHCLFHAQGIEELRHSFIDQKTKEHADDYRRFSKTKADPDVFDDMIRRASAEAYSRWLRNNLRFVQEFGVNRLNQMELTLRYSMFEIFLAKIVGNIVWEYPEILSSEASLQLLEISREKLDLKRCSADTQWRIEKTKALVKKVDFLLFEKPSGKTKLKKKPYLWEYIRDGLGLNFEQHQYAASMAKIRDVRNHLAHESQDVPLPEELMTKVRSHLGGFPILLINAGIQKYPKACEERSEDGWDGLPAYALIDGLF